MSQISARSNSPDAWGRDAKSMPDAASLIVNAARGARREDRPLPSKLFKTMFGVPPPFLAGRERELQTISEVLENIRQGSGDEGLYGLWAPRGRGKTVLLEKMKQMAQTKGIDVIDLYPHDTKREMGEAIMGIGRQTIAEGESGGVETSTGMRFGVEAGVNGSHGTQETLTKTLPAPTPASAIHARLETGGKILLVVDEMQNLRAEAGEALAQAYQTHAKSGRCIGLAYAGTPDLPDRLRRIGISFIGRPGETGEQTLPPIAAADCMLAVFAPFAQHGILPDGMQAEAPSEIATAVAQACSGYPYFTQLWGVALQRALQEAGAMPRSISREAFEKAQAEFESRRNSLHSVLHGELIERGLGECAARIADILLAKGIISEAELVQCANQGLNERDSLAQVGTLRREKKWIDDIRGEGGAIETMLHLGFIWSLKGAMDEKFEAGIPCLMAHVRNAFRNASVTLANNNPSAPAP